MNLLAMPLLALVLACGGGSEQPADGAAPPPAEGAEQPAPKVDPAAHEPVVQALAIHKPEPRCQDVDQLVPDAVAAYRHVIANVKEPTWSPMRAATCLLTQHVREAEVDALQWVADPKAGSLVTVVLSRLDRMPLESAKKIAAAAMTGPHKESAKVQIARLRTPELRAMAFEEK